MNLQCPIFDRLIETLNSKENIKILIEVNLLTIYIFNYINSLVFNPFQLFFDTRVYRVIICRESFNRLQRYEIHNIYIYQRRDGGDRADFEDSLHKNTGT